MSVPSTVADLRHGRQGGRWLPKGHVPVDVATAELCDVCGMAMVVTDGDRHPGCEQPELELFPDAR